MRKAVQTTLLLAVLAALLAWPAAAQGPEGEGPPGGPPPERGPAERPPREGPPGPHPPQFRPPRLHEPIPPPGDIDSGKQIRKRMVILPLFGMLIPIVLILGIVVVVVVALLMAQRSARMRYEMITLALKEGKELPPELWRNGLQRRGDPLLGGLTMTALGLGLGIALGVAVTPSAAVWGLIPLLIGIAILVYVPLYRKQKEEEERP